MLVTVGQNSDILKHYNNKRAFIGHFTRHYFIVDEFFPKAPSKRGFRLNLKLTAPLRLRLIDFGRNSGFKHYNDYCTYKYSTTGEYPSQFLEAVEPKYRRELEQAGWQFIWDRGDWQRQNHHA